MTDRADAIGALTTLFGDRASTAEAVRQHHGHDESWHPAMPPDLVIFPETTDDVAAAARICSAGAVPLVPFGAGTGMEGNVHAARGGVTIDLSRMNRICQVNAPDMDCEVEAGVTRQSLNAHLRDTGLFFAVDPGAESTLGGMAATRASGTMTVMYGSMRENVIGLEAVLSDGTVIQTGGRARKSSAGYDLTRLLVGSEGTLAIITKLRLRLHPIPDAASTIVASFRTIDDAVALVVDLMQMRLPVARAELLDDLEVRAVNAYSGTTLPESPLLLIEFQGTEALVADALITAQDMIASHAPLDVRTATAPEERTKLWQARHNAAFAEILLKPGARAFVTDVAVPLSALPTCIAETRHDLEETGLLAPLVGHVGDGNFHLSLLIDPTSTVEVAAAESFHDRLVRRAIAAGGTSTGEHGIGIGKGRFLALEHGTASVSVMERIKTALDPAGILNPGKVLSVPR